MAETTQAVASTEVAYRVHPLLDPRLPSRNPAVARIWITTYRRAAHDPDFADRLLAMYVRPAGAPDRVAGNAREYLLDADHYIQDLLLLVPDEVARPLRPLPSTLRTADMPGLLRRTFEGPDPRSRYEAQRKLYLAKLLFDVDHCRSVRDGRIHRARFEQLLEDRLWSQAEPGGQVEICCRMANGADGRPRLITGVTPEAGDRCWRFQLRRLPARDHERPVDIYHYRSRFKRESNLDLADRTPDGLLSLTERPRWPALGRRSGSILSKMIRRGIGDPNQVQDVLGAMFIVGDRPQAYALERRLVHTLAGPLRWRDRVDTLVGERDRARLDPHSSSGFAVLKSIVDILVEDDAGKAPYLFGVEIQIYPLEAYLRTLYDGHYASHASYKRRQFLHDLLPILFPVEIYGEETLRAAAGSERARGI